jgi:hypothetical protein
MPTRRNVFSILLIEHEVFVGENGKSVDPYSVISCHKVINGGPAWKRTCKDTPGSKTLEGLRLCKTDKCLIFNKLGQQTLDKLVHTGRLSPPEL